MPRNIPEERKSYLSAINSRKFLKRFWVPGGRVGDEGSLMPKAFFGSTFVVIINVVMKSLLS
jgi:hypothetical protein